MINWNCTKSDTQKIHKIAKRAVIMFEGRLRLMDIDMDLTACHLNDQELNLDRLITFDAFDFCHDIAGINRHIDRETGKLGGCFVPRCAL